MMPKGLAAVNITLVNAISEKQEAQIIPETKPESSPSKKAAVKKTDDKPVKNNSAKADQQTLAANDNVAATIIYQPAPKIPDDLKSAALDDYALVRFHIDERGNAVTEVLRPANNMRLNHILLETLKLWKFRPAYNKGVPQASAFEMHIRFSAEN